MGRPPACNPCCNPVRQGYCTHRKIEPVTPEVEWSRSIDTRTGANTANVYGSAVDASGNLYVGGTYGGDTSGTIQKWSPDGVLLWTVNTPVAIRCVTTDGTYVWAGGFYPFSPSSRPDETLFKLNCSNGVEVWRSSWGTSNIDVNDIVHDGDGQVYLAHTQISCGFVSLVDADGDTVDRFGGNLSCAFQANALALDDSGNVFVVSTVWAADDNSCSPLECGPIGNVAKFNSSHDLVWLTVRNLTSRILCDSLYPTQQLAFAPTSIDWHDGFLFIGYGNVARLAGSTSLAETPSLTDVCTLEKWNATTSLFVWGIPTGESVPDVAADDDFVYAVSGHKLLKISEDGYGYDGGTGLEWCQENIRDAGGPGEAEAPYWTVSLFAGDEYLPDPFVYVGGQAADCTIEDEGSCTIDECFCTYEEQCDCIPPEVGPFGGIYSHHCPCEEIPCSIPDTFYGSGCFEGIEVNYTWNYTSASTWTATFEIPCDGAAHPFVVTLTAVEASDVDCTGWEVTYHITHNASDGSGCDSDITGTATVAECWCTADSPYDHPWFTWQADGIDFGAECVCCDGTGGGGNDPPGGVTVGCCENPVPTTLTITLASTDCPALNGATGTLTHISGVYWEGGVTADGKTIGFGMYCSAPASGCQEFTLSHPDLLIGVGTYDCTPLPVGAAASGCTCDPLVLSWGSLGLQEAGCCMGSISATVTE